MSRIFNHHALTGLPSSALHHLRAVVLQRLGAADLSDSEHAQLHAALECVHAVLRSRAARSRPAPAAPSP